MGCLGFDTSNYTTSVAYADGQTAINCSKLLEVRPGELGLRQSDALFSHVKQLPLLAAQLAEACADRNITAVAASTRPRAVEGSYMPCFLAGETQARVMASMLSVPFFAVSHQQGHLAAALWSAGRMELLRSSFLAWHLSGGTTELLYVTGDGINLNARRIGGTRDLSAGQLIDRTGKLLSLQFPAGKMLDAMAGAAKPFAVRLDGLEFSFSGLQNQVEKLYHSGASEAETAAAALESVSMAVCAATKAALLQYPGLPVLFSGGVASNRRLREHCTEFDAIFAAPQYSTDNAMGVAVLGAEMEAAGWNR